MMTEELECIGDVGKVFGDMEIGYMTWSVLLLN